MTAVNLLTNQEIPVVISAKTTFENFLDTKIGTWHFGGSGAERFTVAVAVNPWLCALFLLLLGEGGRENKRCGVCLGEETYSMINFNGNVIKSVCLMS